MYTTLNKIRAQSPCADGWAKLLKHLGKTQADDEPLSIKTVLESNGISDALWCLRAVEGHERVMRLLAVRYARKVQRLMKDPRSINVLDVAERFANGLADQKDLDAARASAATAAWDAAWDAEWDAARASAATAAWDAARASAARAAATAAWDAARASAATAAARAAARASAARAAEWAAQAQELLRVCDCIDQGVDPYPL